MVHQNSKIFVTGATGFLGSYVVRTLLDQGFQQIYGLKRTDSDVGLLDDVVDQVHWIVGDILDVPFLYDFTADMDVVIHIAALVTFDPSRKKEMQAVNIEGTANLIHASLTNEVKRFLHVSSIAAIGRAKDIVEVDEKTSWAKSKANTFYAITKHHAELEVFKGQAEGLNTVIVNPALILGAGKWTSSSCSLFNKVYHGLSHYPKGTNGVVDVRDVALGIVRALESDVSGERIILSAENISYKTLLSNMANSLGVSGPKKPLDKMTRTFAWIMEWFRSKISGGPPLLTRESVRSTSTTCFYNNQKSIELLGLKYRSVNQLIEDTSASFLADIKSERPSSILPL